jgi:hypothetical protein
MNAMNGRQDSSPAAGLQTGLAVPAPESRRGSEIRDPSV